MLDGPVDLKIGLREVEPPLLGLDRLPLQRPVADPDQPRLARKVQKMRPGIGVVHPEPRIAAGMHGYGGQAHRPPGRHVAAAQHGVEAQEAAAALIGRQLDLLLDAA